jgi:xanthine dehydrogenase accessory factor
MAVFADALVGTIGGGHLEFEAIDRARALLKAEGTDQPPETMRLALGPSLGQCCGGVVHLRLERLTAADASELRRRLDVERLPVVLFGGGHVGHALAEVLARLPVALHWIDSREGIFPTGLPAHVVCEHSEPVQAAVKDLAPGSCVLIMSFSHAEDLDVLTQCLARQRAEQDLPYIGLIGSKTKWATFRHRLEARGYSAEELAQVTCPIGVPGIDGKEPEVIALAVAAQLLQVRAA